VSRRGPQPATAQAGYTDRLRREESTWWKRAVDIRELYGWNLRRLQPGFTLEVGCGLGRNLRHLRGDAVGIDHNPHSVAVCRERGLRAFSPEEFRASEFATPGRFRSLLLAHVLEHMPFDAGVALVRDHLAYVAAGGQLILVVPQEYGYRADPTHVEYYDQARLAALMRAVDVAPVRHYSFLLPHLPFGQLFRHNEFVAVGRLPESPRV
jgi:SAM-dependent methyltransferase